MNCAQSANVLLTRAEKYGTLNVKGDDEHDGRSQLIRRILDIIQVNSQHGRITREVKLMKDLIGCKRKPDEEVSNFIIRFNKTVSLYTNYIGRNSSKFQDHVCPCHLKTTNFQKTASTLSFLNGVNIQKTHQPISQLRYLR